MKTAKSTLKISLILITFLVFTFTNNTYAVQGGGANTGGPANEIPGTGQGEGGPGDSYGPGNGAGQGNPQKDKDKGDSIPLDGGLGVLLLGAATFGVKKLRNNKK